MKRKLLIFVLPLLLSCTHHEEVKVSPEKAQEIAAIGNRAITKLMRELKTNLGLAIKEKGMAGAVEFCANKAQSLAEKVNKELVVVKVTRVSDKYRNPAHKPNKLDRKVLNYFKKELKNGNLPPHYITALREKGKTIYIYYKPIRVAPFCLNCHGNPEKMNPKILKVIREKYPEDRALNYKPGDLRGAFKVVIPEDEV